MIKEARQMTNGTFAMPAAAIARLQEIGHDLQQIEALSYSDRQAAIRAGLKARHGAAYVYIAELYDDVVIYRVEMPRPAGLPTAEYPASEERYYRAPWSITSDDLVSVGDPVEVKRVVSYEQVPAASAEAWVEVDPAAESAEITGDCVALSEKAIAADGTFPVKIIQPGWGSSGYYSEGVLKRDVPKAFPPGTHMYWNHQTPSEESQRPEGDLRNLAAVLVDTPAWQEHGVYGPGMYAKGKAFGEYRKAIEELAPHIGVSIRAFGSAVKGEAEGRKGRIISELSSGRSVDFVTKPGAGGRVLELFESARSGASPTPPQEAKNMDELQEAQARLATAEATITERDGEIARLNEALVARDAEIATLRERELLARACEIVDGKLAEAKLPDVTKARLRAGLTGNPPISEGAIDEAAFETTIRAAIDEATTEVAAIRGGGVRGMGPGQAVESGAQVIESWKHHYMQQGKSSEEAEKLARLASAGR